MIIFFSSKLYVDFHLMGNWIDSPNPQIVHGSAVFGKEFKVRAKLQEKEEYIHVHLLLTLCLICFVCFSAHPLCPTHTHTDTQNFSFFPKHTHADFFPNHLRLVAYIMALYP